MPQSTFDEYKILCLRLIFRIIHIVLLLVAIQTSCYCQWDSLSRVKIDTFSFGRKPYVLSENFPITATGKLTQLRNNTLIDYLFDSTTNTVEIADSTMLVGKDNLIFQYRFYVDFLPDSLGRNYETGIDQKVSYITLDIPQNTRNTSLIPQGLNYSGSFGRGLTAGNSQSLVLNSTFNLQLGGEIGDGIDLRAVISDANIPIQAEGTTQQLQEFDQVFIELTKGQQSLVAGDYRIEKPDGYFINYSKKLKGISYKNGSVYDKKGNLGVSGSFAISGGKFARNQLASKEGNQGPYKLEGAEKEQFIIVQSGSEKIYIDGELLTRGESQDYVIFYDRAEIIFTEKRPITKDSRIIIDFEYLVQNYARSISTFNSDWNIGNHQINFRLYDESDNKNSSGIFELTNNDKKFLSLAGDDPTNNFQTGIFSNPQFDVNGIFYRVELDIEGDTILYFSADPNLAKFQAIFTDVGAGLGSYEIDATNNINGRVYKYIGSGMGRYLPVRKLIPPERKQMYSLSEEFNYDKNGQVKTEFSLSNFNKNLFSSIDQTDNVAFAIRTDWEHTIKLQRRKKEQSKKPDRTGPIVRDSIGGIFNNLKSEDEIIFTAYGEYLQENFNFLNPFRNAEFTRDWNLGNQDINTSELLAGGSVGWVGDCIDCRSEKNLFNYSYSTYVLDDIYTGNRHRLQSNLHGKTILLQLDGSLLLSRGTQFNSTFLRPKGKLDKRWDKLYKVHTGLEYDGEYNNRKSTVTDTLLTGSNEYDVMKAYISSDPEKEVQTSVYYSKRIDRIAADREQKTFSVADNFGVSTKWTGKNQALNLNVNYRILETNESLMQSVEDAKNFLGGIDYQYSAFDGMLRGVSNFNFNSGQEPKREFDYKEVGLGEGNYIWLDNGDGIQDKNEFQPAPFSDQGNFIQVSLFNNEFVQIYKQDYVQTLRIDPIKWKISEQKWKKRISRLSSQTSLRLTRKDFQQDGLPDFRFYVIDESDDQLASFVSSINQNIFWNRGNPAYDIIVNYLSNKSSLLLTTGNEIRNAEIYGLKYRQNILKKAELEVEVNRKSNALRNINFETNNYSITGWVGTITGKIRLKQNFEYRLSSKYEDKRNTLGIEQANSLSGKTGISFTSAKKMRIDANFSLNRIDFISDMNPTIELIMLEGLKDGNNFLWDVGFTKRLVNNFDLTISYNGRKTGESNVVHVANAQIKATF